MTASDAFASARAFGTSGHRGRRTSAAQQFLLRLETSAPAPVDDPQNGSPFPDDLRADPSPETRDLFRRHQLPFFRSRCSSAAPGSHQLPHERRDRVNRYSFPFVSSAGNPAPCPRRGDPPPRSRRRRRGPRRSQPHVEGVPVEDPGERASDDRRRAGRLDRDRGVLPARSRTEVFPATMRSPGAPSTRRRRRCPPCSAGRAPTGRRCSGTARG